MKLLLLVRLRRIQAGKGLNSGSGSVDLDNANIDWRRWCSYVHNPERRWTGSPAVAENWLIVAVEVCQVRRRRIHRPEGCGLVECGLDLVAETKAGLVSSSDQDPPLFLLRASRLNT